MSSQLRIEFDQVNFGYESGPPWARKLTTALQNVSFAISAGETVGLVGESGSGKSTIGKLCLGMLSPRNGQVRFDGERLTRANTKGKVSLVLQNPQWSLDPQQTVLKSVCEPLAIFHVGTEHERRKRANSLLESVGIDPSVAGPRYPSELSGGQRQRVSIARALVFEPEFVLFDEATSALDVSVQAQVLNLILELQVEHGFSAVFISHDLAATRYVSDRVLVLREGEIVDSGDSADFYAASRHQYTRELQLASEI